MDEQRVVEAVVVEAALDVEPLLPALRAGESADAGDEAVDDLVFAGAAGHSGSPPCLSADAMRPDRRRQSERNSPERSEHRLGLAASSDGSGRVRHEQMCEQEGEPSQRTHERSARHMLGQSDASGNSIAMAERDRSGLRRRRVRAVPAERR